MILMDNLLGKKWRAHHDVLGTAFDIIQSVLQSSFLQALLIMNVPRSFINVRQYSQPNGFLHWMNSAGNKVEGLSFDQ